MRKLFTYLLDRTAAALEKLWEKRRYQDIFQLGKAMAPFQEDAWGGIPDCML